MKDTFQSFFIDQLLNSYKRRRGVPNTPAQPISNLPPDTLSPVWRLRGTFYSGFYWQYSKDMFIGLDPHSDTPVEILHVILLGFVKYLWRDVIENQIKKNPERQKTLIVRLSSLEIGGLGLDSKLAGATLVNHYGSLTGSDFRKVAQVAPFVLKDFVSIDCYTTWVALSKLIPLIWQPEILELKSYLVALIPCMITLSNSSFPDDFRK